MSQPLIPQTFIDPAIQRTDASGNLVLPKLVISGPLSLGTAGTVGTSGYMLVSQGPGQPPKWVAQPAGYTGPTIPAPSRTIGLALCIINSNGDLGWDSPWTGPGPGT